ncbi:MAG: Tlg2-vesicle protein [Ramalina farinacea]|uniref:Golgi apparatus membrane protein TVP38 n=1 Tax=Ramalina farinacea TaxID=258253 RepID=A0AA43QKW8_9LECA|nr:Tlg2-vesicle protein [Ramalina farinacea]
MPADYNSTARALALPISPTRSPTQPNQQPWTRRRSSQSPNRNSGTGRRPRPASFLGRNITSLEQQWRRLSHAFERMSPLQQGLSILVGITTIVLSILFLVYSEKIFQSLVPVAEKWKKLRGGWLILWFMCFVTAFPPVIGYSTCLTLSGFIFGFPGGWPIVASATIVGSTCSFIVSRTLLKSFVDRLVVGDKRFEALSLVLKHDGLKLLVMIRLCPLPYSLSNGAISTFPTVQPLMFAGATAAATPKLLIAVFIGSRLAAIAKSREKMDSRTKAINWASIIFGVVLGIATGWLIYTRTLARSRQLEAEGRGNARQATSHSPVFSDDPEEHADTATLIRDDQIDFLHERGEGYRDELTDDEDDVFRFGDEDEEGAIGLDKQPSVRKQRS